MRLATPIGMLFVGRRTAGFWHCVALAIWRATWIFGTGTRSLFEEEVARSRRRALPTKELASRAHTMNRFNDRRPKGAYRPPGARARLKGGGSLASMIPHTRSKNRRRSKGSSGTPSPPFFEYAQKKPSTISLASLLSSRSAPRCVLGRLIARATRGATKWEAAKKRKEAEAAAKALEARNRDGAVDHKTSRPQELPPMVPAALVLGQRTSRPWRPTSSAQGAEKAQEEAESKTAGKLPPSFEGATKPRYTAGRGRSRARGGCGRTLSPKKEQQRRAAACARTTAAPRRRDRASRVARCAGSGPTAARPARLLL